MTPFGVPRARGYVGVGVGGRVSVHAYAREDASTVNSGTPAIWHTD